MVRIMVVDNEPDTVDMIKSILENQGFFVTAAYNGRECLEKVQKESHDLILLDIMMPDMSGWDVYRKIREMNGEMKVAFLSIIEVSPERRMSLIENGLADYIMKPFTSNELIGRIRAIL